MSHRLFEDAETNRRFSRMQWRMLFATMIGYTLFYFMRKNFSFAMPGLQQDCGALVADWGPTMLQESKGFDPSGTGTVIMLADGGAAHNGRENDIIPVGTMAGR